MATAVATFAQVSDMFSSSSPKTVAGLSWNSGDVIVVTAGSEGAANPLNDPTNANLTFTVQVSDEATGAPTYLYTAVAGSTESSQTISQTRQSGSGNWGFSVWIISGASGSFANATQSDVEAAISITTSAESTVVYHTSDWNATQNDEGIEPGSGTPTERYDDGDGASWGHWGGDWVDTDAATDDFGPDTFTGLHSSAVLIEVLVGAAPPATVYPPWPRRSATTVRM